MQKRQHDRSYGMTLIEILTVVSILAILAALVVPHFGNATERAKSSALASQINTVKKALVMYKAEHNGNYPTADQLINIQWHVLINSTDVDGNTAGDDFGPYFQKPPMNVYADSTVVGSNNLGGWQYDPSTGIIRAVVPQSVINQAESLDLNPADLVAAP